MGSLVTQFQEMYEKSAPSMEPDLELINKITSILISGLENAAQRHNNSYSYLWNCSDLILNSNYPLIKDKVESLGFKISVFDQYEGNRISIRLPQKPISTSTSSDNTVSTLKRGFNLLKFLRLCR